MEYRSLIKSLSDIFFASRIRRDVGYRDGIVDFGHNVLFPRRADGSWLEHRASASAAVKARYQLGIADGRAGRSTGASPGPQIADDFIALRKSAGVRQQLPFDGLVYRFL